MSVKILRKFGVLRRVLRGKGSIGLSDGSDVRNARFTLGQLANTRLLICVDVGRSTGDFWFGRLEAKTLQGTLTDGRKISAKGLWIRETQGALFGKKAKLILHSEHWTIGDSSIDGQVSVVFELVNFRFSGTEPEIRMVNGFEHGTLIMTLILGDRQVQLRPIADYDQAIATLRAQSGVQVTCTATTAISAPSEIEAIVSMVDTLCDVMSVARGTLVSWTSLEIRTADELSPYSQYRSSVTRRYAQIELIENDDSQNTKRFLEEGFRKCEELDDDFKVRKIARAFIETKDGPFIESRSLLIAVLVEYLANVRARLEGCANYLNDKPFEKGWKLFKSETKATLKNAYPEISDEHLHSMLLSIKGGLNRRPLKFKIERLAAWLEIQFTPEEIAHFVNARNSLAHDGRFPSGATPTKHYQRMQHFLDRIIMGLFGYQGRYFNFERLI